MTRRPGEDGSVSIWLLTASVVMTILVGLAVDLGGQVHAQQRARDVAGQAARAAGQEVQAAPAIQGVHASVEVAAARAAAQHFLTAASVEGTVTVTGGDTITVRVTDSYHTQYLGLIGIRSVTVTGTASARLIRSVGGTEQ